jgi:hypothetical protein
MITGEIPDEDVDALIPLSWIEKAEERKVPNTWGYVKNLLRGMLPMAVMTYT